MATLYVRNVPDDLLRRVRMEAAEREISVRELVMERLDESGDVASDLEDSRESEASH